MGKMPQRRSEVGSEDLQDLIDTMTKVNSLLSTSSIEDDDAGPVDVLRPPSVFCGDSRNPDLGEDGDQVISIRPPSLFRNSAVNPMETTSSGPMASFAEQDESMDASQDRGTVAESSSIEHAQQWLTSLMELFPAKPSEELRAIALAASSLDDAIQTVIRTQHVGHRENDCSSKDAEQDSNGKLFGGTSWRPTPRPRPRPRSQEAIVTDAVNPSTSATDVREGAAIEPITSTDTDAGFLDCPPPPDFVLEVNKVMFDSGRAGAEANNRRDMYDAVGPPPASSQESISPSTSALLDTTHATSAVVRGTVLSTKEITPANHSAEFSGFDGLDTVELSAPHPTDDVARMPRPAVKEHSIPATDAELRRTVEDLVESRLLRQHQASSEHTSGSDTESITSGMSSDAISQIVAQTVDRLLRDRGTTTSLDTLSPRSSLASTSPRNSGIDDRLLTGGSVPYTAGSDRGDSGYGNDHNSYRDSTGSSASHSSLGSARNGDRGRAPHMPGPSIGSFTALGGRDTQYIAGNNTMDQLATCGGGDKQLKASTKARARDRIRRLVSRRGAPVTGQCIYVQHEPSLGFGFSISGAAPVFVHSIVPGGPCDHGVDGLLPGDVILKIGSVPCATSSRDAVVQLIEAIPPGEYLVTVVARTPILPRKVLPGGRGTQSAPTSPLKARGHAHPHHHSLSGGTTLSPLCRTGSLGHEPDAGAWQRQRRGSDGHDTAGTTNNPRPPLLVDARAKSPSGGPISSAPNIPFSGWLSLLVGGSVGMVWERYWVTIGEGVLAYYEGLDGRNSTPLKPTGTIPLEGAFCSVCGKVDRISRAFAFKIVHKSAAPVYLCAGSETSLWEWIRKITAAADESSTYGFDC
eukprot:m.542334 g.542334  ORF g.542334 m.542334 type:complete len:861 (+) comp22117_c0_seq2:407-2989(+)